ncbi:MAG: hypothetical protein ACYCUM_00240 [Solirubrobacteraceae bacterium]
MPLEADAARWWDDPDLVAVRERIELRRRSETPLATVAAEAVATYRPRGRGVREVRGVARLGLLGPEAVPSGGVRSGGVRSSDGHARDGHARDDDASERPAARRRRPRPSPVERLGPRPDLIAAWAVVLGVVLLIVALITAHG